jgi:hypothetical protein
MRVLAAIVVVLGALTGVAWACSDTCPPGYILDGSACVCIWDGYWCADHPSEPCDCRPGLPREDSHA